MFRAYILLGFTILIAQLHISGNITKYINMKYAYLSTTAAIILGFLTIVQIIVVFQKEHQKEKDQHNCGCDHSHCGHDHSKDENTWWKRTFSYTLFCFPIITGLFFPIATLDSDIVKAKGFHFPVSQPDSQDPFMRRQFLRPDTSIYYAKEGYRDVMEKGKKQFVNKDKVALNDENFLKGMETIYNYPGEFTGKKLTFKGFVFRDDSAKKEQYFLFRFGIIHCVADSGVYGMLVKKPEGVEWKNDDWIEVEGEISTEFYQPFHANIPVLEVTKWNKVEQPKEQYVFRGAD
ncbi:MULTISPECIES: TIGR03943 family putative permease subunit [unclassified Bacillus (in: firmicutes)]|uniref:TIGR03943 family putative permease subunit n=1 Tax=Bacillus TaxID=1386 RepID=UPI001573B392|nr:MULTISPECIES: TIGR03943 family protein [unclassified Bacillus (in: firmicutes)]MBC6972322.1 TIGR03943 family protein [Bacillus sp. Xin]MCI0764289.1 TIGR03943 family protein [Bacillus sp. TL12]NSW38219.1 TIGR03943 family protein [Bacillus sp. Xin1]